MSVCNLKYNVIFIHIPKTAGTSMEQRDFLGGAGHRTMAFYRTVFEGIVGLEEADFFKFAFVRNPYDRFASAAVNHYLVNKDRGGLSEFIFRNKERLEKLEWSETEAGLQHFLPQYKYIYIDGKLAVDFVGRFENLRDDWEKVCARLSVDSSLGHHRGSEFGDYSQLYIPETRKIVGDIYKKDFELFDYDEL